MCWTVNSYEKYSCIQSKAIPLLTAFGFIKNRYREWLWKPTRRLPPSIKPLRSVASRLLLQRRDSKHCPGLEDSRAKLHSSRNVPYPGSETCAYLERVVYMLPEHANSRLFTWQRIRRLFQCSPACLPGLEVQARRTRTTEPKRGAEAQILFAIMEDAHYLLAEGVKLISCHMANVKARQWE